MYAVIWALSTIASGIRVFVMKISVFLYHPCTSESLQLLGGYSSPMYNWQCVRVIPHVQLTRHYKTSLSLNLMPRTVVSRKIEENHLGIMCLLWKRFILDPFKESRTNRTVCVGKWPPHADSTDRLCFRTRAPNVGPRGRQSFAYCWVGSG